MNMLFFISPHESYWIARRKPHLKWTRATSTFHCHNDMKRLTRTVDIDKKLLKGRFSFCSLAHWSFCFSLAILLFQSFFSYFLFGVYVYCCCGFCFFFSHSYSSYIRISSTLCAVLVTGCVVILWILLVVPEDAHSHTHTTPLHRCL